MKRKTNYLVILFLLVTTYAFCHEFPSKNFDHEVQEALHKWQIPGASIAVVKDGVIIFSKGYGVIQIDKKAQVNEHTLFAIGSCSKAFTATALAMLVDTYKISWDEPVADVLRDFYLIDHYITSEVTIRDLLSHRTGLADHDGDLLWYQSPFDRKAIICRLKYLRPISSFRTSFDYQNVLYLAAGEVIPQITHKSWDDFIQTRIFTPLQMQESYTTLSFLEKTSNVASPHYQMNDKIIAYKWYSTDNIAPATGIVSSCHDMAKWLQLQLGTIQGLVSQSALDEMHEPQTIIPSKSFSRTLYPGVHFLSYGLGWFLSDFQGKKLIEHGGMINGMTAHVAIMPEENLGIVVLSNLNCTSFPQAMVNTILEQFLEKSEYNWHAELFHYDQAVANYDKELDKAIKKERITQTAPTLLLNSYSGTYTNDLYGKITISFDAETKKLKTTLFNTTGELAHWHYDTFHFEVKNAKQDPLLIQPLITFTIDEKGQVDSFTIPHMFNDEVFEKTN